MVLAYSLTEEVDNYALIKSRAHGCCYTPDRLSLDKLLLTDDVHRYPSPVLKQKLSLSNPVVCSLVLACPSRIVEHSPKR